MRIFLITGATIGFVGTAVGLALGLLVAYNVEPIRKFLSWITGANLFPSEFYFLSQLPSRIETDRRSLGRRHGADPVAGGDDLSVLARGKARSGRGAAL